MVDAGTMFDTINQHIQDGKALHIRRAVNPPGWDIVVNHLQGCADGEYAGVPYGILSYQLNQAEEIPEIKKAIDYFNTHLALKIFDAHIFTSFTTSTETQKHIDNHNVLIWSISGNMLVHLYEDYESEPYYTVEFEKGDMVYIPADVIHRVEPLGARALVSFGIEVSPGVLYNSPLDNVYEKVQHGQEA